MKRKLKLLCMLSIIIIIPVAAMGMASAAMSAYTQIEGENASELNGVQAENCSEGGQDVGFIESGDSMSFKGVDFGSNGPESVEFRVASATQGDVGADLGKRIEIRVDSATGDVIGTASPQITGDWQKYVTVKGEISKKVTGVHDLYLIFTDGQFNINWLKFTEASASAASADTKDAAASAPAKDQGSADKSAPVSNPKTGDAGVVVYGLTAIMSLAAIIRKNK